MQGKNNLYRPRIEITTTQKSIEKDLDNKTISTSGKWVRNNAKTTVTSVDAPFSVRLQNTHSHNEMSKLGAKELSSFATTELKNYERSSIPKCIDIAHKFDDTAMESLLVDKNGNYMHAATKRVMEGVFNEIQKGLNGTKADIKAKKNTIKEQLIDRTKNRDLVSTRIAKKSKYQHKTLSIKSLKRHAMMDVQTNLYINIAKEIKSPFGLLLFYNTLRSHTKLTKMQPKQIEQIKKQLQNIVEDQFKKTVDGILEEEPPSKNKTYHNRTHFDDADWAVEKLMQLKELTHIIRELHPELLEHSTKIHLRARKKMSQGLPYELPKTTLSKKKLLFRLLTHRLYSKFTRDMSMVSPNQYNAITLEACKHATVKTWNFLVKKIMDNLYPRIEDEDSYMYAIEHANLKKTRTIFAHSLAIGDLTNNIGTITIKVLKLQKYIQSHSGEKKISSKKLALQRNIQSLARDIRNNATFNEIIQNPKNAARCEELQKLVNTQYIEVDTEILSVNISQLVDIEGWFRSEEDKFTKTEPSFEYNDVFIPKELTSAHLNSPPRQNDTHHDSYDSNQALNSQWDIPVNSAAVEQKKHNINMRNNNSTESYRSDNYESMNTEHHPMAKMKQTTIKPPNHQNETPHNYEPTYAEVNKIAKTQGEISNPHHTSSSPPPPPPPPPIEEPSHQTTRSRIPEDAVNVLSQLHSKPEGKLKLPEEEGARSLEEVLELTTKRMSRTRDYDRLNNLAIGTLGREKIAETKERFLEKKRLEEEKARNEMKTRTKIDSTKKSGQMYPNLRGMNNYLNDDKT